MIDIGFIQRIAEATSLRVEQVQKAIEFLDGGATIPFVARYRRDVTDDLDEEKLEEIARLNARYRSLTDRRAAVLEAIAKQSRLTNELRQAIEECTDGAALEDLFLPYKRKRRTKAAVAREKGLAPLADFLWAQELGEQSIEEYAATFARPEKALASAEEALEGAVLLLAEQLFLDPDVRSLIRKTMLEDGKLVAHPTKNAEGKKTKFEAYYDFSEPIAKIPSHRFLAVLRGVKQGFLRVELSIDDGEILGGLLQKLLKEPDSPFEPHVRKVVEEAYHQWLRPALEEETLSVARSRADEDAIRVFRANARGLLLASPAGAIAVIGIDPSQSDGFTLAAVDASGAFVESTVIHPATPEKDGNPPEEILLALMAKHGVSAIAIGNGGGAREIARFVKEALAKTGNDGVFSVFVNEAGASVYASSKAAREEFANEDSAVRSAISIARRLQDPLAELVKIEPRHIGVGQYQHDVNQRQLREGLHNTVVSCVSRVGVDLNKASAALLRYVSGIQPDAAENAVAQREKLGGFTSREQLLEVAGIGPKVYEQCAGFVKIVDGANPLDATGIHPEAYPVVERMAETVGLSVGDLLGNGDVLKDLDLSPFADGYIGRLTLEDIRNELIKPGRDPRTVFKVPKFLEGVHSVADLEEGMETEGVVTNVTDFGAFVDVGVQQDGLVHLSELANRYVQDPRDIVQVGEIIRVKVIKVDKELPRISLSRKALLAPKPEKPRKSRQRRRPPEHAKAPAEAKDRESARASDREAPKRRPRKRSAPRKGASKKRTYASTKPGDAAGPLNTQLADQLAALKEELGT